MRLNLDFLKHKLDKAFKFKAEEVLGVLNLLGDQQVGVEVYEEGRGGLRFITSGRVRKVSEERLAIQAVDRETMIRKPRHTRMTVFFPPVKLDNRSFNTFQALLEGVYMKDGLQYLVMTTPPQVALASRRKQFRVKVEDQELVRVRLWPEFYEHDRRAWVDKRPLLEVNTANAALGEDATRVLDISVNGLGLWLSPEDGPNTPSLVPGAKVRLSVSLYEPDLDRYTELVCAGLVRNRFPVGDGESLGIQFYLRGRIPKGLGVQLTWDKVDPETGIPDLARLIANIREHQAGD